MSDKIKTAVVTGRHGFDVVGFTEMFRALPTVDPYIQHMEHFCADPGRDAYDVILFYHMITEGPTDAQRQGLEGILDNGQGLFILHHAILGWPEWAEYSELVGIGDRSFDTDMGQNLPVDVATPDHPITRDLPSTWQIEDETYSMADAEASDGNDVLLTTEHEVSMHGLAWTRQQQDSRVFCFQCGHDNLAYVNAQMRMVVQRGIEWCAARI